MVVDRGALVGPFQGSENSKHFFFRCEFLRYYVGPSWGHCEAKVGPSWCFGAHVGAILAHLRTILLLWWLIAGVRVEPFKGSEN